MSPLIAFEPMRLIPFAIYGLAAMLMLAVLPKLSGTRGRLDDSEEEDVADKMPRPAGPLAGAQLLVVDDEPVDSAGAPRGGVYVCYRLDAFHTHADDIHAIAATNRSEPKRQSCAIAEERIKSVDRVMADSYAPSSSPGTIMPAEQRKKRSLIQRFSDIRTLITHTVDPVVVECFQDLDL